MSSIVAGKPQFCGELRYGSYYEWKFASDDQTIDLNKCLGPFTAESDGDVRNVDSCFSTGARQFVARYKTGRWRQLEP